MGIGIWSATARYYFNYGVACYIVLTIFLLNIALSFAQSIPEGLTPVINSEDDLYDLFNEDQITDEEFDNLYNLIKEKVEINSDQLERLLDIPGIEEEDIDNIYSYRKRYGPFKDLKELCNLLGKGKYRLIEAFIFLSPPSLFKGRLSMETKDLFDDDATPEYESRIKLLYDKATGYAFVEKAIGSDQYLLKYGYVSLKEINPIHLLTIGDYKAKFGAGLVLNEQLHGGYLALKCGKFCPSLLYANEEEDTLWAMNVDISLPNKSDAGFSYLNADSGIGTTTLLAAGFHINLYTNRWLQIFSEIAESSEANISGNGFIAGIQFFRDNLSVKSSYRNYNPEFKNPYSNGFADTDGDDNDSDEKGYYLDCRYKATPWLTLRGYYDQWKTISELKPNEEGFYELEGRWHKGINLTLNQKYRNEDTENSGDEEINTTCILKCDLISYTSITISYKISFEKDVDEEESGDYIKVVTDFSPPFLPVKCVGYVKFDDIFEAYDQKTKYYLRVTDNLRLPIKLDIMYTYTEYTSTTTPNPKEECKFEIEYLF